MKADATLETIVRFAHTLAYDSRIVQGTQDSVPLPAVAGSSTSPAMIVGEGSEPFFHAGALALAELLRNTATARCQARTTAPSVAHEAVASSINRFLHGGR